MDKQELAKHLAQRSRQSRGNAADKLDDLIYKLWKASRNTKPTDKPNEFKGISTAPVKKP